ncbi:MAG: hypothetical protein QG567_1379, partial [Campylobacterota bacterium]|nr:hypothetical protein [Campylobacterota bacterium]
MNSADSIKNFIIESVRAFEDKIAKKEFAFSSITERNAYKTCQIYALSYEKGLGLKNLKDEVKSNAMVELLRELNQRADGVIVGAEKSEAFKAHSREIVAIAKEIDLLLKRDGVAADSFRIAGYKYDFLADVNQLVVAYSDGNLEINVDFNVDKLESKIYITPALVKEWANVDIAHLPKLEEIGRIEEINRVIEKLLRDVNDVIARITIKNKLDIIGESLKNNKIDNENIYEIFAQAILSIDNVNLMDCLSDKIYSQKFYNQHLLGSRESDNKEAYEIIKTLHEKTPDEDLVMCFLDINIFKTINDELGHDVGDKAIIELSNQLKEPIGESGIVSRRGGDEFIIIAPSSAITKVVSSQLSAETVAKNSAMIKDFVSALPDNDERKNRDFSHI